MKTILVHIVLIAIFLRLGSAELSFFEFVAEEYDNVVNSSHSYLMTSTELRREKELLQTTSNILINEVSEAIKEELVEAQLEKVSNMISEHTVPLYNVLDQMKSFESDLTEKRLKIVDIFIPKNNSIQTINEIIESFY